MADPLLTLPRREGRRSHQPVTRNRPGQIITGWTEGLQVTADGTGIVSHAGVALVRAGGGALSSGQLPFPDCVGQVGHPLRRLRADLLQGHAARVHALEQADSGAEQHG